MQNHAPLVVSRRRLVLVVGTRLALALVAGAVTGWATERRIWWLAIPAGIAAVLSLGLIFVLVRARQQGQLGVRG